MKRITNPDYKSPKLVAIQQRRHQQRIVEIAVRVIEKVHQIKTGKRKLIRRLVIHKQPNSKYFKYLWKASKYILEMKGDYNNEFEDVFTDYITLIYDIYINKYNRIPTLLNFSPSTNNQINFQEYIDAMEIYYKDSYWIDGGKSMREIRESAGEKIKQMAKADELLRKDPKQFISEQMGIAKMEKRNGRVGKANDSKG